MRSGRASWRAWRSWRFASSLNPPQATSAKKYRFVRRSNFQLTKPIQIPNIRSLVGVRKSKARKGVLAMERVDPVRALMRQQLLASAAGRAVDECLPQLTAVDAALPPTRLRKTNPIRSRPMNPAPHGALDRAGLRGAPPASRPSPALDQSLPHLTPVDRALPNSQLCKTNPILSEPSSALSPRQLAAARLTAHGRRVVEVAAELGVSRQSLWNWSRQPAFIAEVRRLHELLARDANVRRRELGRR